MSYSRLEKLQVVIDLMSRFPDNYSFNTLVTSEFLTWVDQYDLDTLESLYFSPHRSSYPENVQRAFDRVLSA